MRRWSVVAPEAPRPPCRLHEEVDLGFQLLAELDRMDDGVNYTRVMNRVSQDTFTGQSRSFAEAHWPNLENERHAVQDEQEW